MEWTLRKKILLGYSMTLTLAVVVLVWALLSLLRLGRASDAILRENYPSIHTAESMLDALERQDRAILYLLLGHKTEGLRESQEHEALFFQWLARAKDDIDVEGEEAVMKRIESGYEKYLANISKLELMFQFDPNTAHKFYREKLYPSLMEVRDACKELRHLSEKTMLKAGDHAQHTAARAIWSMIAIGVAAVAIALSFSLFLSTRLVRPVRQLMEATQKIGGGEYDFAIAEESSDELGRLAHEFNAMVGKLKEYHDLNLGQIVWEKRKAEAVIQSIDDGIVVVDARFRITGINRTAAKMFGLEPAQAMDRHFLDVVGDERILSYLKQSAETGAVPEIEESNRVLSIEQGNGQRHYHFSITPVKSEAGSMVGVVLLLRDVTRLKELDSLKTEFVMTASHELRTPLTGIAMSIDLLRERAMGKLDERDRQLLDAAHEEVQRLKVLVSNLLDLSRIEAGKIEMEFDRVPVELLFDKALPPFKAQAEEKSVTFALTLPPRLPGVKADAHKITWVLTNLISNALRYTGPGGQIRLRAENFGPQVHISVSDDGPGIPYEFQTKIFQKFVQVKGDKASGSGLGLAICREIVRAHSGAIWVDSTPGQGSTFTFTLPVSQ
jgi:NtrC-family two-component system sensor histidine kinase KinB